jgi:ribosomal protein S18 acetylase RimI-like enzyme
MDPNQRVGPILRVGTDADARGVAALHAGQIGEGFLSSLGTGFLRLLYRRITRTSDSFLLVAEDRGRLVGFIAGSTNVGGLYRSFVLRDGIRAVLTSAPRLLRSWRSAIETLGHGTDEPAAEAELLAVAVDPGYQGRGTGRLLVEGFLTELAQRSRESAHVVVAADNQPAIALYERSGFRTVRQFELHAGAVSLDMQWPPPGETSG